MATSIGVIKEAREGETRVAVVPEVAARYAKAGFGVRVESGAGDAAGFEDSLYRESGAELVARREALQADLIATVNGIGREDLAAVRAESTVLGFLSPLDRPQEVAALAKTGATAYSVELIPRISRAQKMDALSATSSLAGYKAVLLAASHLPRFFPLLTTAAGTVKPAQVLVLGAGVAGLQAIATARRLGARVSAFDVREAVKEEIQSLGAAWVDLDLQAQQDKDSGGYAKALSEDQAKAQVEALVPHVKRSDVVITTALVPGRPAPLLVTEEAVRGMRSGSVVVDMAAANGGNCAPSKADEAVKLDGVTVLGPTNLPAQMPQDASTLYARTLAAFIQEFSDEGVFRPDFEDEIVTGACVTRDGEVVNERVKSLL
jgi:NAD(P) transhydrogenase subunit alpha